MNKINSLNANDEIIKLLEPLPEWFSEKYESETELSNGYVYCIFRVYSETNDVTITVKALPHNGRLLVTNQLKNKLITNGILN